MCRYRWGWKGWGGDSAYTIHSECNSGLSQISKIINLTNSISKFFIFTHYIDGECIKKNEMNLFNNIQNYNEMDLFNNIQNYNEMDLLNNIQNYC